MPNPPLTKILDRLYVGDGKAGRTASILREHNISALVSLSVIPWVHWTLPRFKEVISDDNHLFIPCADTMTMDLLPELANICDFIRQRIERPEFRSILVHCDRGVSRSVTAMAAYLMQDCGYDQASALALIGSERKIRPNKNFEEQLEVWKTVGGEIWTAEGTPKEAYAAYLAKRAERLKEAGLTGNEPIQIQSL